MVSRLAWLILGLIWGLGALAPKWAWATSNEEFVSWRVGQAEGSLAAIGYLDWLFTSAQSVAEKNAAVGTVLSFEIFDRSWSASEKESRAPGDLVATFLQTVSLRHRAQGTRLRADNSAEQSWLQSLLGSKSEQSLQADRVWQNLEVHPDFEFLKAEVVRLNSNLQEEISDPRLVNRASIAFKSGQTMALRRTLSFFRTEMHMKDRASPGLDEIQNLSRNIQDLEKRISKIADLLEQGPTHVSEVARLMRDYQEALIKISSSSALEPSAWVRLGVLKPDPAQRIHVLRTLRASAENFSRLIREELARLHLDFMVLPNQQTNHTCKDIYQHGHGSASF